MARVRALLAGWDNAGGATPQTAGDARAGVWRPRSLPLCDCLHGHLARSPVGVVEGLERAHRLAAQLIEYLLDDVGNLEEAQPLLQERVHGDLVGGVEYAWRSAALARRVSGEAQAWKGVEVDSLECQLPYGLQVERRHRQPHALAAVQRVGDRDAHVGRPEVGEHRAVSESTVQRTSDCGCTTTSMRS